VRTRRLIPIALALVSLALLLRPERALSAVRWALSSPYFPLLLAAAYLLRPFLAWPISLLSALVGYRYGVIALPLALAGAVVTSLPPYYLAERFTPETPSGLAARLAGGSERYFDAAGDLRGVVAARLFPTPPEAVSAAAAVAGVRLRTFVLGTVLGELPWTVAAVAAGASMRRFGMPEVDPRLLALALLVGAALLAHAAYER
jgi:uncharacterized membrane protein YdjX (TVP38/TMEM64 family)